MMRSETPFRKTFLTKALPDLRRASRADVILLALWFALNLVLLCFHEPWRDEAEAFMIARSYGPAGLWQQLSSEGQPLLWFLVLFLPAKLGIPFRLIGVISLLVCAAAVIRFLRVSPLPKPLTWLILFSPLFMYYNPALAQAAAAGAWRDGGAAVPDASHAGWCRARGDAKAAGGVDFQS